MAALECWTDAQVVEWPLPARYGVPDIAALDAYERPDLRAWKKTALEDPAVRGADYVLTGVYVNLPKEKSWRLHVILLDAHKAPDQTPVEVLQEDTQKTQTFKACAEQQRRVARPVVDKLVERGLARQRAPAKVKGIRLDQELRETADLLAAGDSWAVMEGIDRALQLAALFPKETLPLQAAAYGYNALSWPIFHYSVFSPCWAEYGLRAFALEQLTLAIDPKPSLSQLNWLNTVRLFDQVPEVYRGKFTGEDRTGLQQELAVYRAPVLLDIPTLPREQLDTAPDWQALRLQYDLYKEYHRSEYNDYSEARIGAWRQRDLGLMVMIRDAKNHPFARNRTEPPRAAAQTVAAIG
ncbi:MAG: hypothetical protein NTW86_22010, partial [Candidatus Sumerlaeota bacterium]|nr:hypothetical protein [Candidatus Sumerlaeota bacterium]